MEQWRNIEGYDYPYQVSNLGRIKSLEYKDKAGRNRKEKIRDIKPNSIGYIKVALRKDGKEIKVAVHRLVAEHFLENPEFKEEVNHIDGNKSNNHVDNLEWVTKRENLIHKQYVLNNNSIQNYPVLCIETNVIYPSQRKAVEAIGVSEAALSKCISKGNHATCGGYHWLRLEGDVA